MSQSHNKPQVQHCDTMAQVRAHIDALDAQLVPLIAARSAYVAQAGRIKQSADQVRDQARIDAILARVRRLAAEHGAPPAILEATWRAMMDASIAFEHVEFARQHRESKA